MVSLSVVCCVRFAGCACLCVCLLMFCDYLCVCVCLRFLVGAWSVLFWSVNCIAFKKKEVFFL